MWSLKEVIQVYWAKRKAQYKAIEAVYKRKGLDSAAVIKIDKEAIEEVQAQRKRMNKQDAKEKKKQKRKRQKEKRRNKRVIKKI